MWKDPIVEEIHAIREQIAQECDYDIKQIIARLRKHEKEHPDRLVYHEFELSFSHEGDIYVDGTPIEMNVKERYETLVLR